MQLIRRETVDAAESAKTILQGWEMYRHNLMPSLSDGESDVEGR